MRFEWDRDKDRGNRSKHGIGFGEAIGLFQGDHVRFELATGPERRWAVVGRLGSKFWTGIFTRRQGRIRWISVRRSRASEEEYFGRYFQ